MRSYRTVTVEQVVAAVRGGRQVLDVRAPDEREEVAIDRSLHRYVPDLAHAPPAGLDPEDPVWTVCSSGFRATIAAGLLERHGFEPAVLDHQGVEAVLDALGESPADHATTPAG